MKKLLFLLAFAFSLPVFAQKNAPAKAPENWFNLSYSTAKVHGVQTERTYTELLKGKTPDTVIVAVIDGGVDYAHEDLKDVMWRNPGEIPGNKIDDDKNGYVDDIYGWNFIGNANGENVQYDNLELVRLLRPLDKKFKGKSESTVGPSEKADFALYTKLKTDFDKQVAETQKTIDQLNNFKRVLSALERDIREQRKVDTVLYNDFVAYKPTDQFKKIYFVMKTIIKSEDDWTAVHAELRDGTKELQNRLDYNLNLDYDPRSIVGDNYANQDERYYGNPDIKGPDAGHGTHVAGIIAANRFNNVGVLGVATPVKIMGVRVVPNGDERDKDVANGIRYAVDNGAKIINMSFGKSYGYNKKIVDDAVKYAESKGVLLIHAAGNDDKDNDATDNFPNAFYEGGGTATNWIEVGAISWRDGKQLVAPFSNWGQTKVDVFAPGVDINSAKPDGGYVSQSGTSMASPVTAGVAAMLKAYYPNLTPAEIRSIIMQSSDKSMAKKKVIIPGEKKKKTKFSKLSVTGGIVDMYAAFQLAANPAPAVK